MLVFSCRDPRGETYVDVFLDYPMPWEPLWRDAEIMTIEEVPVRVASLEHLIALKRAADRPRDRDDVEQLSQLRALGSQHPDGEAPPESPEPPSPERPQ
jgi:predicted nucleotidyltransferase